MSGLIAICQRDPADAADLTAVLRRCAARLAPDDISPRPPEVRSSPGFAFIVTNPAPGLPLGGEAACLGVLERPAPEWQTVGAPPPDGTYALVRADGERLELISDALASRTLWYVHTPRLFLASTSQRALVSLLGDLVPDCAAVTWMATSGTLGPSASWDARLSRLPGDSVLVLDRHSWSLRLDTRPVVFAPAQGTDDSLVAKLGDAIDASCASADLDLTRWVLPLSGGMNSRALLIALLRAGRPPRCVTWGLSSSPDDPRNDAAVAKALAERMGVEHRYYPIDHSSEDQERVLRRFLVAGEGRAEDFGGYTDGFATWRQLYGSGVAGVIRGDEPGWGYGSYYSEEYARRKLRLRVLSDYAPGHLIQRLGLEPQPVPPALRRREGETFAAYNDRVDDCFLVPTRFAALNDLKAPYVEIANPLLTRRVVQVARSLPDHLRRERGAFESYVRSHGPDLPFAEHHAPADPEEYLARPPFLDELKRELGSTAAESVLGRQELDSLVAALVRPSTVSVRRRLRSAAMKVVPVDLARRVRRNPALFLSARELAFRIYIASRMTELLRGDAAASAEVWGDARPDREATCPD